MLVADKKVLKANLVKGSIAVQYKLVQLYVTNLGTLGTNAALIAAMTLIGLLETIYPVNGFIPDDVFGFIFYIFALLAWIYSLLCYCEAAVSVIWGPVMALSGGNSDEVMFAIKNMKLQQKDSFRFGAWAGFYLLLAMMVYTYALQGLAVGGICTVVYIGAFYMIISEGDKVMTEFDVDRLYAHETTDVDEMESHERVSQIVEQMSKMGVGASVDHSKDEKREALWEDIIARKEEELMKCKGRGVIWMKAEGANCFKRIYLVAQKARLEFYQSEDDFLQATNMCDTPPIELKNYHLETDMRKINAQSLKRYTASSKIREMVLGTNELSFTDNMTADFDTANAIKNFKFSLSPKYQTEIEKIESIHFMAEDLSNYAQWLKLLRNMNTISDEIAVVKKSLDHSRGTTEVTRAVQRAATSTSGTSI